jgi:hypothetical protein
MSLDREYFILHFAILLALPKGVSTGKLNKYINGSKHCAKTKCNTMITTPRWHMHPSSGANRPSDVVLTVNIKDDINQMAAEPKIEWCSRDFVPEYCHCLDPSTIYTAPPCVVEFLPGRSN